LCLRTIVPINSYDLFICANHLSFEVKRDVQIVDLKEISTVFAAQIVGTKEVLYCEDEIEMANYDMMAFKEYAILNEEREMILEKIKEYGKLYS